MTITVNFNSKDIQKLSKQMNELHRSSFPVAVRETLNNTAFDVKKFEIKKSAKQNFIVRNERFFNKFSKVVKASGFNVNSMNAKVGMLNQPVSKNFHEQEVGGKLKRVAIPNIEARTSRNNRKKIAKKHYLNNNSIIDQNRGSRKRTEKSQRVADAYMAKKTGKWLFKNDTIFEVRSFRKTKTRVRIKMKPLYSIKKGRNVNIKGTGFIEQAATAALPRMKRHFQVSANKQFKKYFK